MPLVIPERTVENPGHDYGLKVLDPVDEIDIFNAKFPIFGSDITNKTPQIITHEIQVTNSSGRFNEPANPTFTWINDGNWKYTTFNQLNDVIIATIPHGQGRVPQFMVTGFATIRRTMRMRYWQQDFPSGSIAYNSIYNAVGGFRTTPITPRLGGVGSLLEYPTSFEAFEFSGVGPYTSSVYGSVAGSSLRMTADDTNIYVRATITQNFNYQRFRTGSTGFDRYEKYWHDLSGSLYTFTFYILPYDKNEDIYIR